MKIPEWIETPIHTDPSPMLIHFTRGRLKNISGEEINFFKAGDAFVETNNESDHYLKTLGRNLLFFM